MTHAQRLERTQSLQWRQESGETKITTISRAWVTGVVQTPEKRKGRGRRNVKPMREPGHVGVEAPQGLQIPNKPWGVGGEGHRTMDPREMLKLGI